jgi:hypothetical protein
MSRIEASKNYRFEVREQQLVIFYYLDDDQTEREYGILFNGIANIKEETQVSEWVAHLYKKLWISTEMLYDLAKQIQNISPDNEIDWVKTFFMVEKHQHLQENKTQENESEAPTSIFKTVRSEIMLSRDLADDAEFNHKLTEKVIERLKSKQLF